MERALRKIAEESGSRPEQNWYGTFHNVYGRDWLTIEYFTRDGWQTAPASDPVDAPLLDEVNR